MRTHSKSMNLHTVHMYYVEYDKLDKLKFMVLEARTKGYTIQQNMMYNMHDTYEDIVFILQATKKDNI